MFGNNKTNRNSGEIMKFIFFIVLWISNLTFSQNQYKYNSYLAHITPANSSLRLNETAEAIKWLNKSPQSYRGWEWQLLNTPD